MVLLQYTRMRSMQLSTDIMQLCKSTVINVTPTRMTGLPLGLCTQYMMGCHPFCRYRTTQHTNYCMERCFFFEMIRYIRSISTRGNTPHITVHRTFNFLTVRSMFIICGVYYGKVYLLITCHIPDCIIAPHVILYARIRRKCVPVVVDIYPK